MINLDRAFSTSNKSVFDYFQKAGVGYYIPLYQREYSWDNDNIDQFLEDITKGIEALIDSSDQDNEIRFLGTIITVEDVQKLQYDSTQDRRAVPTAVEKIIDGQQRLSTIALTSTLLNYYIRLTIKTLKEKLVRSALGLSEIEKQQLELEMTGIQSFWDRKLSTLFSVNLHTGQNNNLKPKIIRGNQDRWMYDIGDGQGYNSDVALELYRYIEFFEGRDDNYEPRFAKKNSTNTNLSSINEWIKKRVLTAHINDSDLFSSGGSILESISQDNLWNYNRGDFFSPIVNNIQDQKDKTKFSYHLNSLVQLCAASHFLLDRCCFTIIQPSTEDWAFDMFQSLNGTGTPLTAIETFLPLVINLVTLNGFNYKESPDKVNFDKVLAALSEKVASRKTKKTNELLTSFALPAKGDKLATHFSAQRRWLEKILTKDITDFRSQRAFIEFLGTYSEFYSKYWNGYTAENGQPLDFLIGDSEADLISLLLLFLKASNHFMCLTVLGSAYYKWASTRNVASLNNFKKCVKITAAFYILWRSCTTNTGLDDAYRVFFKGSSASPLQHPPHNYLSNNLIDSTELRQYFISVLNSNNGKTPITKTEWINAACNFAGYDSSTQIARLTLLISANDTIPDNSLPGLSKRGTRDSRPYLKLANWLSADLSSIEHVAPQTPDNSWDDQIYFLHLEDRLGNLTLLPQSINSSAGNRPWTEKQLYYKHLGKTDPLEIEQITNEAIASGINLNQETIEMLKSARHLSHIEPIVSMQNQPWNSQLIDARSRNILGYVHETIYSWLNI